MTKPGKMWQLINDLAKNKLKVKFGPAKIEIDLRTITDQTEIF